MVLPLLAAIGPWMPAIGAGISALGSLFAPAPQAQTITNSIDLKKLRADAEEAGFNPLTIIRGGGLAGYGSQHIPAGPDTRLSDAFRTFGSGLANVQLDPIGQARGLAELKLAELQIRDWGKTGVGSNLSFETPKAVGVMSPLKPLRLGGFDIVPNPANSNAQDFEDRWGEMADWLVGPVIATGDVAYTLKQHGVRVEKERGGKPREASWLTGLNDLYMTWRGGFVEAHGGVR